MLLGVIADDMTGATDIGSMLSRKGMTTLQVVGVPRDVDQLKAADAVIVALKSRSCMVESAVRESLASCDILLAAGAKQIVFKYCSTFDSTAKGNIGPVADALLERLGARRAIVCPALPDNGRTVYQGRLFVGTTPLNESSMKDHPLTPMRDFEHCPSSATTNTSQGNTVAAFDRERRCGIGKRRHGEGGGRRISLRCG